MDEDTAEAIQQEIKAKCGIILMKGTIKDIAPIFAKYQEETHG